MPLQWAHDHYRSSTTMTMDELHGKLASHPNVRDAIVQFSIGCGADCLEPPKSLFKPLENAFTMGS